MFRKTLPYLAVTVLVASVACQSDPAANATRKTSEQIESAPAKTPDLVVMNEDAEESAFTAFAAYAFPPLLPQNENHSNSWLRKDCLLCHQAGISGAPVIKHESMSDALLSARCRTCHLDAPATADLSEYDHSFSSDAFPPTLPFDDTHGQAWLKDDCMLCHETGVGRAPIVKHTGMADDLLLGRCRSCHLPSVSSSEAEYTTSR